MRLSERLRRSRARREARALVRHVRSVLRRHPERAPGDVAPEIAAAADRLDAAIKAGDHDAICRGLTEVDVHAERHLTFARRSPLREYAQSIGGALLVALFLRAFVVEAFKIPTGSMIPTLEVGDHLFVNKFLYGLRIPGIDGRKFFTWRKPKAGEVIVFVYPKDPSKDFIKRVVAVEGDRVEVRDNVVFVNGKQIPHRALDHEPHVYWDFNEATQEWDTRQAWRYEEELGGQRFITLVDPDHWGAKSDFPGPGDPDPYVIPPGYVFVLGDNRSNSHDSRYWGNVPLENIKGKAMVIWWSAGEPEGVRFPRIGRAVD